MRRHYQPGDRATIAREMEYYDQVEGHYEPLAECDYDLILAHLSDSAHPVAILEIGCGSGAFGARLQKRFASSVNVGLDVSFNLLCRHSGAPVLGDGRRLPFPNETFDLIAASAALHHIHGLAQTINEVYRCLKPGGCVIFVEPNADHPYRRIVVDGGFLRNWFLKTSDESIFPTDLVALMNSAGFQNTNFEYATFRNRQPSLLGKLQWWIARPRWHRSLVRFIHAWFIVVSEKR